MTACLHCGAPTSNGLVLCDLAQIGAAKSLEFIPVYFHNLARWRPDRAGSRPVPGSRVLWDGTDRTGPSDRVQRALEQAANDLHRLTERLAEERGIQIPSRDTEAERAAAHCRILTEHLAHISAATWAEVFLRKVSEHEEILRALTEEVAPGWYAGGCKQKIADSPDGPVLCDSGIYVVPGLTWVTCRACGITTYARDHLDTVLDEARAWTARPKALAEAIVALVDTETSVSRLYERMKKWAQRDKITAVRASRTEYVYDLESRTTVLREVEVGPSKYVLGDVLDLVRSKR